jgi:glutaredoxin
MRLLDARSAFTALRALTIGLPLCLSLAAAQAQAVYRIVGPDGRVTFSDVPPPKAPASATAKPGAAGGGAAALPYALQQVASRYPVTLYTGENCGPCDSGRAYLRGRGIPFTERTVKSNEDVQALQRLAGDASLPLLTVGSQQLKGYSDVEWGQYLDAAGYPKTSQLPRGYEAPAPSPLVAVERPAPAQPARPAAAEPEVKIDAVNTRARPAPATPIAPQPNAENPAGIRF